MNNDYFLDNSILTDEDLLQVSAGASEEVTQPPIEDRGSGKEYIIPARPHKPSGVGF